MEKNQIIGTTVVAILLISLFFLIKLNFNEQTYLEPTSPIRFNVFIAEHVFMMFMMVWFTVLKETYEYVRWAFTLSFVIALATTFVELSIFLNRS